MAENPEPPGTGEPAPEPFPAVDLPAGFFDDADTTEAAPPTFAAEPPPAPADKPRFEMADFPPPAPALSPEPTRHPIFPFLVGVVFVGLMVAGAVLNSQPSGATTSAASPAAPAATPDPAEPAAKEKETAVTALSGQVATLQEKLGALTKQIGELQGRIDTLPKPAPAPDLKPLQSKVEELAKASEATAPLSEKLGALDTRVAALGKSLQALEGSLASLRTDLGALRDQKKPAPASTASAAPVDVNEEAQSYSQAVELFQAGKYKEARDVLRTSEANEPKDARVWYYAALSQGLATNEWRGEVERLVHKGVEREKAGTPSTSEIDAAFAKLSPPAVKNWLDYYRKNARK